ncbi:hypothetical protein B0H13DRAFT_1856600 [Mycena leptocephala]|nr:hypothetical protein B0H13DRAFT_1856600 [Mycena leptocephala]
MTSFNKASSGTESSVPVAATDAGDQNMIAAAAFRTMLSTMADFSQASAPAPVVAAASSVAPTAGPVAFRTRGPWVASALYKVVPGGPLVAVAEDETSEENPLWYCITKGLYVGVTLNNALALGAVSGVSRSSMKSFKSQVLVLACFNELLEYGMMKRQDEAWISVRTHAARCAITPLGYPGIQLGSGWQAIFSCGPAPSNPISATPPYTTPPGHHTLPTVRSRTYTANTSMPMIYRYDSPTQSGHTTQWSRAAATTQGFLALLEEASPLVSGVSNNLFRGYDSVEEAHAAYAYAHARSWTRIAGAPVSAIPALPQPVSLVPSVANNPLNGAEDLDDTCLKCQLNTLGVRGAVHESVVGKAAALAKFAAAMECPNEIVVVTPTYSNHDPSDPFL